MLLESLTIAASIPKNKPGTGSKLTGRITPLESLPINSLALPEPLRLFQKVENLFFKLFNCIIFLSYL